METNGLGQHASAEDIARLAYSLWQARGEAQGTPDEDWYRAEELLRASAAASASSSAGQE